MKTIFLILNLVIMSSLVASAMSNYSTFRIHKNPVKNLGETELPPIINDIGGGVNDGGSGNSPTPSRMDEETFKRFTGYTLKRLLRIIFQTMEINSSKQSSITVSLLGHIQVKENLMEIINGIKLKLFKKDKTIFEMLENAKLIAQKLPCNAPYDYVLSDGSADIKNLTVCLSYDRLSPKLSMEEFSQHIVALAAHEYSHLLGTNETEANIIQQEVLNNIRLGGSEGELLLSLAKRSLLGTEPILTILKGIRSYIEKEQKKLLVRGALSCGEIHMIDKFFFAIISKRSDFNMIFNLTVGGIELHKHKTHFKENLDSLIVICDSDSSKQTIEKQETLNRLDEMITAIEFMNKEKGKL